QAAIWLGCPTCSRNPPSAEVSGAKRAVSSSWSDVTWWSPPRAASARSKTCVGMYESPTTRIFMAASGVDARRDQVDGVPAARLEHELPRRLGVEVVEVDGLTDAAAHQHRRALGLELRLERVRLGLRVLHARDVLQALAVLLQELLVDARPFERLDQLDD